MLSNSLMQIKPYRTAPANAWSFDDENVGLVAEPFVAGVPQMIDAMLMVQGINDVQECTLLFGAMPFPGHQVKLVWLEEESGGNWYEMEVEGMDSKMTGWLCPALLKYFKEAPKEIYVSVGE